MEDVNNYLSWDLGFEPISENESSYLESSPEFEPLNDIFNNDDLESLLTSFETPLPIESPSHHEDLVDFISDDHKVDVVTSPSTSSSATEESVGVEELVPTLDADSAITQQIVVNTALDDHNYLSSETRIKVIVAKPVKESTEQFQPVECIPILPNKSHNVRILLKSKEPQGGQPTIQPLEVGEDFLDFGSNTNDEIPYKRKYPMLMLSEEEKKLCEKDGIELPSHYPLTREEETDLKRIRRKIRNKKSAQMSRKRKRDYLGDIETRAEESEAENKRLKRKISVLETQNQTLMNQLRRMQQLVIETTANKGVGGVKASTTTLMVLLLSAALFAVPGLRDRYGSKPQLEQTVSGQSPGRVIGPGQSRSLLHYLGNNMQPEALHDILDKATIREMADKFMSFGSEPSHDIIETNKVNNETAAGRRTLTTIEESRNNRFQKK